MRPNVYFLALPCDHSDKCIIFASNSLQEAMKQINQNDQNDEIVIYQSKDGKTRLGVKLYASDELYENGTCSILVHRDNDGKQRAQALSDMP